MAVEPRRGCGYRKVGGLYLVGGKGPGIECCRMPIVLHICPTCSQGIKQTRGWSWIDPRPWLKGPCEKGLGHTMICPAASDSMGNRVGLIWIGTQFYPTPNTFLHEADTQGISRRISALPKGFELGRDWVFLAHPKAVASIDAEGKPVMLPAVFRIFKPTAIEKIVTDQTPFDELEALRKKGITPVVVPHDDKDHQGSVYDADTEELPL